MEITKKEIAECVGLWLAEGDHKTKREITFTNNCWDLVKLFHEVISFLYRNEKINPRIYTYAKEKVISPYLERVAVKSYQDNRANKPYFLYRVASVQLVKQWKKLVESYISDVESSNDLLRGFFAGEGNIKTGKSSNRVIRISQKQPMECITKILQDLKLTFSFSPRERTYVIWSRESWDKLAKVQVADLHQLKREKFWSVYQQFKEYHYSSGFLKNSVYEILKEIRTRNELSQILNRTPARMNDVLLELKTERKIINFNVRSSSYWIRTDQNIIIISSIKQKYLNLLSKFNKTYQFAQELGVDWKSAHKRLNELKKLGLVSFKDNKWTKEPISQQIVVK